MVRLTARRALIGLAVVLALSIGIGAGLLYQRRLAPAGRTPVRQLRAGQSLCDDIQSDDIADDVVHDVVSSPECIDPLDGRTPALGRSTAYFAVVVENAPAARPQHGLSRARMVYEMLVEGGITRFLALYSQAGSYRIGPIRSARTYIVELASQHGVMLAHCGGSPQALAMMANRRCRSLNEMSNGAAFFRDNGRKAPHNLYAYAQSLVDRAARLGYSTDSAMSGVVFREAEYCADDPGGAVTIRYSQNYSVTWEYDTRSNSYVRFMSKAPHIDPDTGAHIAAKNVVIQYVPTRVIDAEGRLAMDLGGPGQAVLLSGGSAMTGRWSRPSADPAVFIGPDGKKLRFNPGVTWVQIVPVGADVKISEG